MALTCTPNGLLAEAPCALCLSQKQLLAVVALILCKISGGPRADCDPETLGDDSDCFKCMDDKQMLVAFGNMLWRYAVDNGYILVNEGNIDDAVCLDCLPPRELKAIILKKMCDLLSLGVWS